MTKSEEIAIIRELARRLGPDSYFGPVLAEQIWEIEQDIASDIYPVATVARAKADCAEIKREADERANLMIARATNEAQAIVANAHEQAATAVSLARRELQRAIACLE
jgi:cell division septum initiation protein DivIVA